MKNVNKVKIFRAIWISVKDKKINKSIIYCINRNVTSKPKTHQNLKNF